MLALIVLILLLASFVLALLAAFGTPSKLGLHALAFALFVLAVILEHGPALHTLT
jgi:hypothetical protein